MARPDRRLGILGDISIERWSRVAKFIPVHWIVGYNRQRRSGHYDQYIFLERANWDDDWGQWINSFGEIWLSGRVDEKSG